ncbi:MAG: sigma-70 family RNA polymerase sigma factor [Nitrospirota bacterium]
MMQKIAERDATAFARFYDHHAKFIFAFLNRFLKKRVESEDILQETFWRLWQKAAMYDPTAGSPAAWVCSIARDLGKSRFKQLLRQRERDADLKAFPIAQPSKMNASILGSSKSRPGIGGALLEISKEQQEVIMLSFFEGVTHEEIANRLHIPIGIVKSRIRLGMNSLNVIIQKDVGADVDKKL